MSYDCITKEKAFKLVSTILKGFIINGAAGRTRTDTLIRREILSLLCLPISPPRRRFVKLVIMTRSGSFKQESGLLGIQKPDPYAYQGNKIIDPVVLRSSISL